MMYGVMVDGSIDIDKRTLSLNTGHKTYKLSVSCGYDVIRKNARSTVISDLIVWKIEKFI